MANFIENGEYGLMNYEYLDADGNKFIVSEYGTHDNEIKIGDWNKPFRILKTDVPQLIEILKNLTK